MASKQVKNVTTFLGVQMRAVLGIIALVTSFSAPLLAEDDEVDGRHYTTYMEAEKECSAEAARQERDYMISPCWSWTGAFLGYQCRLGEPLEK